MEETIIEVTTHEFKNNISQYLSALRRGKYKAIVIKRYNRRLAVLMDHNPKNIDYPRRTWRD